MRQVRRLRARQRTQPVPLNGAQLFSAPVDTVIQGHPGTVPRWPTDGGKGWIVLSWEWMAPFWSALIVEANGVVFLNLPESLLPGLKDQQTHLR